jgi:integrase
MQGDNVRRIISQRAEAIGLGVVATHDLRRTFAGWLDEDGVGLSGVQAALRHSTPAVTVACYLDPSPRRALEAVKDLRLGIG